MLNPLMLLGLAALGIPVLIHLINRRRMKPRQFATLDFLDQQDVANAFAPVPRDLLQLLLRLLLLTLFILLMVRMTGSSPTVGPRAVAIVLDNSMSMKRLTPDGRRLVDVHRERILDLIRGMKQGDYFSFTLVGDQVFDSTGFTSDRARLEQAVTNAWASDGGARSLIATLEDSLRELRSRRAPNTALIVFSDQQSQNYRSQLAAPSLAPMLRGSRIKPVFVLDPLTNAPNVQLKGAEFYPERIYLGASGKVTARMHNASETQQVVTVSLKSGTVAVETRSCNLATGETAHVELRQSFGSPNDTAWCVNLSEDGFLADNDAYATVRMRSRRQVLLVTSMQYPKPEGLTLGTSGADLLTCALNPAEATGEALAETYISVKRVSMMDLERRALSMYSVIVLYGLDQLASPEVVQDLAGYVRQGGGLYIIPDAAVNSPTFNRELAPLLSGFQLGDWRDPKIAAPLDNNEKNVADPLLLGLIRGEWGTVNDIRFARYFEALDIGSTRAALKTQDGDVLLAIAEMGKGRVCIQTHSWNVEDTSLPRSLSFVGVAHAVVDHLSSLDADTEGYSGPDHILAGASLRMGLPQFRGLGGDVTLEGPRSYAFKMSSEDAYVTVKDVYVAGAYRATHPGKAAARDRWLAVNPATDESSSAFMSADELAGLCGVGQVTATSDRLDGLFRPRRELFILLLTLVFVALTAETAGTLLSRQKKETHGSGA
jgi:hypothetical protein